MVAAVIVAAGAGRRLGTRCKATLATSDGRTFLEAIATAARAAGVTGIVVVTGRPHTAATAAEAGRLGLGCIDNPDPDRGMGSSVAIGFSHAVDAFSEARAALLWPVDHPYVKTETVRAILDASASDTVVIPRFDDRGGHPPAFGRALWPALCTADGLPEGARSVLRAVDTRRMFLPTDDPGVLADVDTREDLR